MDMSNPWHQISTDIYEKHMSHEAVQQMQMLSRITGEQLRLVQDIHLPSVAFLGITNGNGLEHVSRELFRSVIAMDINQEFIDVCRQKYSILTPILQLHRIDLISEKEKAIQLLAEADLVTANLLIEHIHLDTFLAIADALTHARISITIQVNPDRILTSHSGYEQAFDKVVNFMQECNEAAIVSGMTDIGYHRFGGENHTLGKTVYDLPNGKQFFRLDFTRN